MPDKYHNSASINTKENGLADAIFKEFYADFTTLLSRDVVVGYSVVFYWMNHRFNLNRDQGLILLKWWSEAGKVELVRFGRVRILRCGDK